MSLKAIEAKDITLGLDSDTIVSEQPRSGFQYKDSQQFLSLLDTWPADLLLCYLT